MVIKKAVDHIVCLVHKCSLVDIARPTEETDVLLGSLVNIGNRVTFRVEECDFTGSLPYIWGKLRDLRYVWHKYEQDIDGKIILRWIFRKLERSWAG
jgi:hypothetical protein